MSAIITVLESPVGTPEVVKVVNSVGNDTVASSTAFQNVVQTIRDKVSVPILCGGFFVLLVGISAVFVAVDLLHYNNMVSSLISAKDSVLAFLSSTFDRIVAFFSNLITWDFTGAFNVIANAFRDAYDAMIRLFNLIKNKITGKTDDSVLPK